MITKEYTYTKAFENKKEKLAEKKKKYNIMLAAAYATNPRLDEIDSQLSRVGIALATAALNGGKDIEKLKKYSKALSLEKQEILRSADVKPIEYDCEACSDTGYVSGKVCDCIKKAASGIMMTELSTEMPLEASRFDNFSLEYYGTEDTPMGNPRRRMANILRLCEEYAENFNPKSSPNLLFMGGAGLGKTHLTLAIVSGLIDKGFSPFYGPAEAVFSEIWIERYESKERTVSEAVNDCDLLVIDDLGTEISNEFTRSVLYNIINSRLLSKKPTIINTNLSMAEIEALYTARVSSRLIGEYDAHKFIGKDIRQQKAMKLKK